ncbi:BC1872 family protein [Paenibacillus ottowii]
MNRDEVIAKWNSMQPRERDAWIATDVMEWKQGADYDFVYDMENGIAKYKPFSTDVRTFNPSAYISDAWEVIEKISSLKEWMLYRIGHSDVDGELKYECTMLEVYRGVSVFARSKSASEAICLAALIAVLTQGEGIEQ